jgi:hypothetical protein
MKKFKKSPKPLKGLFRAFSPQSLLDIGRIMINVLNDKLKEKNSHNQAAALFPFRG